MSMYIRIKRRNQTFFMHVESSNTFADIKQRVGEILTIDSSCVALYLDTKKADELVDLATVGDRELQNDQVIYMVTKKEGTESWEDIEIETFDVHMIGEEKEEK
mmetsp:Transcript_28738/g.37718  ORF Transcript_28738/g.37718 Transcript_28738/m.37718 type:complete len:104 (+) Transcript_28738:54-365(+)